MSSFSPVASPSSSLRNDWSQNEIDQLFDLPFMEVLFQAHQIHRANFDVNDIQVSTLLSIKTGSCPEDCGYCSQSGHYQTEVEKEKLMSLDQVTREAEKAKAAGATRFCMGAAWRTPPEKAMPQIQEMIKVVKGLGLESCMTLGMLNETQVETLKGAGLDYYNHNLDTSPEYYPEVVTTRTYQDRLETLDRVRTSGIKVCCGGILGLGESRKDRVSLLQQLATMAEHPESVPMNMLVKVEGTPLASAEEEVDSIEFIRTIAVARILMPTSRLRLSAGRETMTEEAQALCFFAGANSIFYGDKLLTTSNPETSSDRQLFEKLGLNSEGFTQSVSENALTEAIADNLIPCHSL